MMNEYNVESKRESFFAVAVCAHENFICAASVLFLGQSFVKFRL